MNWNTQFFTGLIYSNEITTKEWEDHLIEKKNNSVEAKCRKTIRNVQKWLPRNDPLHNFQSNPKTAKLSKSIGNKLDNIDLLINNEEFANLWLSNKVSGVEGRTGSRSRDD